MEKDEILNKLAGMDVDSLDKMRDKKILDLRDTLAKLYKAKDSLLVSRHEKRKALVAEGNSLSKVEQILRGDEGLFLMKRIVMELTEVKNKINLELELLKAYFWRNKA